MTTDPKASGKALAEHSSDSLQMQVERLCQVHGKAVVLAAVSRASPAKRGRKREADGEFLKRVSEQDARDWLDGRDPVKLRPNTSLAIEEASARPGQSILSTTRRLQKKLSKTREKFMFYMAERISKTEYPAERYVETVRNLVRVWPMYSQILAVSSAEADIVACEALFPGKVNGKPISWIRDKLKKSLASDPSSIILEHLTSRGLAAK